MITYNEEFYDNMNKDILEVSKSDEITTEELERRVINISHILNQLEEHKNLLNHYKNEYSQILKKKCVHEWKPDYSDSQENRTDFYCQKCNIYKSDLLYNR